jgi:hypothetical protein
MRGMTLCGLIGAVLCVLIACEATAQQPPLQVASPAAQPPARKPEDNGNIFFFTTVEILDSDSELTKLLKQRFNAAGEELEARSELYRGGRVELDSVLACLERFTKFGLELNPSPAEQLNHLGSSLLAAQKVEAIVREKFNHSVEPVQAMKHANVVRYDLEIQLYRARELAKAKAVRK